jgi:protein-S-isoprenylcysteine O-methyltransferase Ste14
MIVDHVFPAALILSWRACLATATSEPTAYPAAGLFRRLGTHVPPSQPTTLIATTGPYRWTRNPMYLGMALIYAGLAIGFDGPIALALLPLVLIAIQTQVIAREERYLEAKFGDDYRRYKAEVRRWL